MRELARALPEAHLLPLKPLRIQLEEAGACCKCRQGKRGISLRSLWGDENRRMRGGGCNPRLSGTRMRFCIMKAERVIEIKGMMEAILLG